MRSYWITAVFTTYQQATSNSISLQHRHALADGDEKNGVHQLEIRGF